MLAAMKLGAVVIPATTLLTHRRPARPPRARRRRHVDRRSAADAASSRRCTGDYTRIARRRRARRAGTALRRRRGAVAATFTPDGPTRADRSAAAVLHLGHDGASPSSCCTRTRAIRSATSRRCTGSACSPATCTQHQLAGLGQARLELLLRAVERRRHVFIYNYARFNAQAAAGRARALPRHHAVRAADRVAHADPGGPRGVRGRRCASWSAPASRSTPRSSSRCGSAWGITIRDGYGQTETTAQIGNSAGPAGEAGLDGPAAAGLRRRRCSTPTATPATRARSASPLDRRARSA